jgi:hypothetical protein
MKTETSLPCSNNLEAGRYPEQARSSPHAHTGANKYLFFFSRFIKSSWMQTQIINSPWLLIPFTRMFNETEQVYPLLYFFFFL